MRRGQKSTLPTESAVSGDYGGGGIRTPALFPTDSERGDEADTADEPTQPPAPNLEPGVTEEFGTQAGEC